MIYIHKIGSVVRNQDETLDVKAAWKAISPKMIRRTDRYIQLALLGANAAVADMDLDRSTALYMASGQGNLAVFKRLRDQRYILKQPPKPVDFINSLSNTSGFYVAQYFGINGKNLNVSRLGFVSATLLLLAQNDLTLGREKQILLGGVDELQEPFSFTRKTLGVCDERSLGEGSNWLLLSTQKEDALGTLEVLKSEMVMSTLQEYIKEIPLNVAFAFGQRFTPTLKAELLGAEHSERQVFEAPCDFYETASLYILNCFIAQGEGELLFIETYDEKFRVVRVSKL